MPQIYADPSTGRQFVIYGGMPIPLDSGGAPTGAGADPAAAPATPGAAPTGPPAPASGFLQNLKSGFATAVGPGTLQGLGAAAEATGELTGNETIKSYTKPFAQSLRDVGDALQSNIAQPEELSLQNLREDPLGTAGSFLGTAGGAVTQSAAPVAALGLLGSAFGPAGTALGVAAGTYGPELLLNLGDNYDSLIKAGQTDKKLAAEIAVLAALPQSLVSKFGVNKLIGGQAKELVGKYFPRVLGRIGETAKEEGLEEITQGGIQEAATAIGGPNYKPEGIVGRLALQGALGATGGGAFGGAYEAARRPFQTIEEPVEPPPPPGPPAPGTVTPTPSPMDAITQAGFPKPLKEVEPTDRPGLGLRGEVPPEPPPPPPPVAVAEPPPASEPEVTQPGFPAPLRPRETADLPGLGLRAEPTDPMAAIAAAGRRPPPPPPPPPGGGPPGPAPIVPPPPPGTVPTEPTVPTVPTPAEAITAAGKPKRESALDAIIRSVNRDLKTETDPDERALLVRRLVAAGGTPPPTATVPVVTPAPTSVPLPTEVAAATTGQKPTPRTKRVDGLTVPQAWAKAPPPAQSNDEYRDRLMAAARSVREAGDERQATMLETLARDPTPERMATLPGREADVGLAFPGFVPLPLRQGGKAAKSPARIAPAVAPITKTPTAPAAKISAPPAPIKGTVPKPARAKAAPAAATVLPPAAKAQVPAIAGKRVVAAKDDVDEVASANFTNGMVAGNETVPIESLKGGVSQSTTEAPRVDRLAKQIDSPDGYIERLIVDDEGTVLEGQHRYEALKKLGIKQVPVTRVVDVGRNRPVQAMREAAKGAGLRGDNVPQIVQNSLEMLQDSDGDVDRALADNELPRGWEAPYRAVLEAARGRTRPAATTPATVLPGGAKRQAVALLRGTEPRPPLVQTDPDVKKGPTRLVGEALEARTRGQQRYGVIERDDTSEAARDKIAGYIADEVMSELEPERIASSAYGWYSKKYQSALDSFGRVFPEMVGGKVKGKLPGVAKFNGDPQQARQFFTWIAAITSDGMKARDNFYLATKLYEKFRRTGQIPTNFTEGSKANEGMKENARRLNTLLDRYGGEMTRILLQEKTVSELNKLAKAEGIEFSSGYPATATIPYAGVLFGPKLGIFGSNLNGSEGHLTMDRWWSRSFNRFRGQLIPLIKGLAGNPRDEQGNLIGLARFKQIINDPDLSDSEAMDLVRQYTNDYAGRNFKHTDKNKKLIVKQEVADREKAANTIYKDAYGELEDQPFSIADRSFMIDTVRKSQELLKARGRDLSIADIQAVQWYFEKRLYVAMGARESGDTSYDQVAEEIANGLDANLRPGVGFDAALSTSREDANRQIAQSRRAAVARRAADKRAAVRAAKLSAGAKARVAALDDPEAWVERGKDVQRSIRDLVNRITGGRVKLNLNGRLIASDGTPVNGGYLRGVIHLALNDSANPDADVRRSLADVLGTARHEGIHFLRDVGAISPAEWKTLSKRAAKWREQFKIDEAYADMGLTEDELVEEAIAEAYARWGAGTLPKLLAPNTIFEKIKAFLEGLRQSLYRTFGALPTAGEIFAAIEAGTFADRGGAIGSRVEQMYALPAWHGTEPDFDSFSMAYLGTGEGTQAFGHGLYFASRQKVAEYYRDLVSREKVVKEFRDQLPDASDFDEVMELVEAGGVKPNTARVLRALEADNWLGFDYPAQAISAAFKDLEAYDPSPELQAAVKEYGKLYKVELGFDNEDIIDWDGPLAKQPAKIRGAFEDLLDDPSFSPPSPQGTIRVIDNAAGKVIGRIRPVEGGYSVDISNGKAFRGLKNDPVFKTMKEAKAQWTTALSGETAYRRLEVQLGSQAKASKALLKAGIPGLRFLDQASRSGRIDDKTHNYVVFDDSLVRIEAKYQRARLADTRADFIAAPSKTGVAKSFEQLTNAKNRGGFWKDTVLPYLIRNTANRLDPFARIDVRRFGKIPVDKTSLFKTAELHMQDTGRFEMMAYWGVPFWNAADGFIDIDESGGGLVPRRGEPGTGVFNEIKGPADYNKLGAFMVANRAKRLITEGRERLLTQDQIDAALNVTPDERARYERMIGRYNTWNGKLLQLLVDTGAIKQKDKDVYTEHMDYVPFYRVIEDSGELISPNALRKGFNNPDPKIKKLLGGTGKVGDVFENIAQNARALVSAAGRNVTAAKARDILVQMNEADEGAGDGAISYFDKGEKKYYRPHDPAVYAALAAQPAQNLGFLYNFMTAASGIFRAGITSTPGFLVANLLRGSAAAFIQTGMNVSGKYNTASGLRNALKNSASVRTIKAASGTGGYRFGAGSGALSGTMLRRAAGAEQGNYIADLARRAFDILQHVGEATEFADRDAVYNNHIAKGSTRFEAVYQAMNVVNYGRKGAAKSLQFIIPLVPFLNPRIQGLYRMFENHGDRSVLPGIALRGALLMAASTLLWAYHAWDDDEWEKYQGEDLDRRINNWIVYTDFFGMTEPKKLLIPKPFEFGALFATIPEALTEAFFTDKGGRELGSVAAQTFGNTFSFNPIPQVVVPAVEVYANYDFFKTRPLESMAEQRLPPGQRATAFTSGAARAIGSVTGPTVGLSPIEVQHLIEGYLGTAGQMLLAGTDAVAGAGGVLPSKPTGSFGSIPVVSRAAEIGFGRFVRDEDIDTASQWVNQLYDLKEEADQVYAGARQMKANGELVEARKLIADNKGLLSARAGLDKAGAAMAEISRELNRIRGSNLGPTEMRAKLAPLIKRRNDLARKITEAAQKRIDLAEAA